MPGEVTWVMQSAAGSAPAARRVTGIILVGQKPHLWTRDDAYFKFFCNANSHTIISLLLSR
jgi:hypothetical protein